MIFNFIKGKPKHIKIDQTFRGIRKEGLRPVSVTLTAREVRELANNSSLALDLSTALIPEHYAAR